MNWGEVAENAPEIGETFLGNVPDGTEYRGTSEMMNSGFTDQTEISSGFVKWNKHFDWKLKASSFVNIGGKLVLDF